MGIANKKTTPLKNLVVISCLILSYKRAIKVVKVLAVNDKENTNSGNIYKKFFWQ
jgi:hypothetical protein